MARALWPRVASLTGVAVGLEGGRALVAVVTRPIAVALAIFAAAAVSVAIAVLVVTVNRRGVVHWKKS